MLTQLSYLIKSNWNINDPNNRNLGIAMLVSMVDHNLHQLSLNKLKTSSACQSGKDRDGLLVFKINNTSLNQYLLDMFITVNNDLLKEKTYIENVRSLLLAGHTQFMAGFLGGTLAAFGIKSDSIAAIPENEFPKDLIPLLVLPTASYNKHINFDYSLSFLDKTYYHSNSLDINDQIFLLMYALILHKEVETN
jgi:hypothetical protein